jgi:hypothetical protein
VRPMWMARMRGKWLPTALLAFMSVVTLAALAVSLFALYLWCAASHGAFDHITK